MSDALRQVRFLLVEDDDDHADLTRRVLVECRVTNAIERASDGEEALRYLKREPPFQERVRPDVVLLDLNLPKLNGHELLAIVKNDPDLASIPVVILTTSSAERDIALAYETKANSYVVKPLDFDCFNEIVSSLGFYWAMCNRAP